MRPEARAPSYDYTQIVPIYFDTMHNVCASGGFAQYEVNQFCRRVKAHGIPMEMLDSWYSSIHSPRQGFAKLSKHWFSKRITDASDGSHCRAYASEMLTVVSVLSCFADEWLTPQGYSFYIAAAVLAKPPTIRPRPVDMFLFETDMFLVRGNIVAHVPLKYIDQPVRSYRVSILLETCRLL
jgi:hypothetical protein